ncbi:MAG TPA: PD-(D/E)XK nuclease family protein [Prolixibacteraceae bacterium]|nr:PD-(D/E)XK nuclease family protein [Prolixibacteraceae bacterium]
MEKFLKTTASYLLNRYQQNLPGLTVVFPNRRAGLFFRQYLSECIEQPIFSPRIQTISELIEENANLKKASTEELIIELWKVFTRITGIDESLDDFYFWGEMLLHDFNEMDQYRIDARKLFSNIYSLKELDTVFDYLDDNQRTILSSFWKTILEVKDSIDKQRFLKVWGDLFPVYDTFKKQLRARGIGYEGMIYRDLAERLDNPDFHLPETKWSFIGFNALNRCEQELFKHLKNNASALFFWDYDDYYLQKTHHEAALFLRSNLSQFPPPDDFLFQTDSFSALKEAEVVSVPGFSGQALVAARWLEENRAPGTRRYDHTAVVFCNEALLVPALNTLPGSVESVNITMGFPLKDAPAYSLIRNLAELDRNSRPDEKGQALFYHRQVLSLLNHPLLSVLVSEAREQLTNDIHRKNQIYCTVADMGISDFLRTLFTLPVQSPEIGAYIRQIVAQIVPSLPENDVLARESLYQLLLLTNRLQRSLFGSDHNKDVGLSKKLFYQLLLRQLERITVPFEGEPLSGVQFMGFLETRCLDFDQVILLSFNDDRLPGSGHRHSFIPYNLRKGFGLPLPEHHNAMYSYYFYRLIQRAQKVCMVYDSRTEGLSRGEVSRFALQLKYEANTLQLNEKQAVFPYEPAESSGIEIEKTPALIERIEQYLTQKGLTPSALNRYIDCPLRFYFRYIEGLEEHDELSEEIDPVLFGRIAHKALEEIYRPWVGKTIETKAIDTILNDQRNMERSLTLALQQEYFRGGTATLNGKNKLIFDIIREYVETILKYDRTNVPFYLIGLENRFSDILRIPSGEKIIPVKISGFIDRVDKKEGMLRVIDYKTGRDKNSVDSIENLFIANENRNKAALQTLFYARCLQAHFPGETKILPAVYGANNIFQKDFNPVFVCNKKELIFQDVAEEFNTHLEQILTQLLHPDLPFTQTDDDKKCTFCEFNGICNRKNLAD